MYSGKQIIEYWRKYRKRTVISRKPEVVAIKSYLIGILYYKYDFTEEELGKIFRMNRSSVMYSKQIPYNCLNTGDKVFKESTKIVRELFPYDFPDPATVRRNVRVGHRVLLDDNKLYGKLRSHAMSVGLPIHKVLQMIIIEKLELDEQNKE